MPPEGPPVRVFVVSTLPAVRAGLAALVGAAPGCAIVGQALLPAPAAWEELGVDVAVIDAEPDLLPAELLGQGDAAERPGLVLLGAVLADRRLAATLAGRGWAYLAREATGEQVVAAVLAVARGLVVLDPGPGGRLLSRAPDEPAGEPSEVDLTPRELEVLGLLALGLPNKSIAARLSISDHTVKFHVAAILGKLGAGSRTEAVHLAARRGLIAL